jgi:(p)ppGpp synthase/HD superfamily hydrolase
MTRYTSKFSPTEKKALELATRYHQGQKRMGGEDYINHPIEVADLLFHYGFRGKYVFTALCHDLPEDTDVTDQEILETCGRLTLEADRLLTKRRKNEPDKEVDMKVYLAAIRKNDVAYQVKVADRAMNLQSAILAGILFREKYLAETEKYYLDFAKDSPMFAELKLAYETLRRDTELEKRSRVSVEIDKVEEEDETSSCVTIQAFKPGGRTPPLICEVSRRELEEVSGNKDLIVRIHKTEFYS